MPHTIEQLEERESYRDRYDRRMVSLQRRQRQRELLALVRQENEAVLRGDYRAADCYAADANAIAEELAGWR